MRITRQRLKEIIMEEIELVEGSPDMVDLEADNGNAPANQGGMDEITEEELEEGMEMITPENIKLVADVVAQMGMNFAPAIIMAALAMPGIEAVKYLKQKATEKSTEESPETALEEDQMDALTNLISQVVQEKIS